MNKAIAVIATGILFTGAISLSHAAGNAGAGKTKTAACAGCHGDNGNSIAPLFPMLAAQHPSYLAKQLHDFKSQRRSNPTMEAMAAPLSDQDIDDISAFYAQQAITFQGNTATGYLDQNKQVEITEVLVEAGKNIYLNGHASSGVPACSGCHGPAGSGNAPAGFPALKGQFGAYLAKTLSAYKSGDRANDPEAVMQAIAQRMNQDQINAVSAYIANLR